MTSLAATIALVTLLAQPSAPQVAPTLADKPAPPDKPAPAATSSTAGPWVIGEAKCYRAELEAMEAASSPDNPGHKSDKKSKDTCIVRIVPRSLDAAKQVFELTPVAIKLEMTTPMGAVLADTAAVGEPKDEMSRELRKMLKVVPATPVTITVEGGAVKSITGNEAATDTKKPGGGFVAAFYSDAAITERFAGCFALGNGAAAIAPGTTWPADVSHDFRKLMSIKCPATAKVESVTDGVAKVVFSPAEGARAVPDPAGLEMLKTLNGTVTENICSGHVLWSIADRRPVSVSTTCGYDLKFNVSTMKGDQRNTRVLNVERVPAPAAPEAPAAPVAPAAPIPKS